MQNSMKLYVLIYFAQGVNNIQLRHKTPQSLMAFKQLH